MRTQILLAFNAWYKVPDSTLAVITDIVNMLHNASLLFVIIFITT
jgi:geranylgeranyl diphosphate synthase type 3